MRTPLASDEAGAEHERIDHRPLGDEVDCDAHQRRRQHELLLQRRFGGFRVVRETGEGRGQEANRDAGRRDEGWGRGARSVAR